MSANLTLRVLTGGTGNTVKNAPLSNIEMDRNFINLDNEIDTKAPIDSPTLTGTPLAPTAAIGTNNTQIASTAFVQQTSTDNAMAMAIALG